jgi:hypothetical protein
MLSEKEQYDVIFVDQLSASIPLLRWSGVRVGSRVRVRASATILLADYRDMHDNLLIPHRCYSTVIFRTSF